MISSKQDNEKDSFLNNKNLNEGKNKTAQKDYNKKLIL